MLDAVLHCLMVAGSRRTHTARHIPQRLLLTPQFQYGEDGVDVMSVGYLRAFTFLARNAYRCAEAAQSFLADFQAAHEPQRD